MKKYYITTPIYYINDKPHIGHAYCTIAADVLARYHRLLGDDVYFLTGTDENSQKNVDAANALGKGGDIKGYVDEMAAIWQETFDSMGITNDDFIRTTDERHLVAVKKFFELVNKTGDIYEGVYEGYYCVGCESFLVESDLIDGKCPIHKKTADLLKEKNYFFKLTKYRDKLLEHIEKNPEFIMPVSRRNEVISYIDKFMTDVSISRASMKWGIPLPIDETQRIYVWFDALINYLSGVGFGADDAKFNKYWPADLHLVGKEIIKFHCALWPAMLMSAGLPLPKRIFAHGFFTLNGEKISKSLGNVIDPIEAQKKYGIDALRYFLLREMTFGEDGDFSFDRMKARYENDLADELGNLVSRTIAMTEKYFNGVVPEKASGFLSSVFPGYCVAMDELRFHDALEIIWKIVREANQFVDINQPWTLAKLGETKKLGDVIYILLETIRHIAWLIYPFMPETSEKILKQLGLQFSAEFGIDVYKSWVWGELAPGGTINKKEIIFPKETKELES